MQLSNRFEWSCELAALTQHEHTFPGNFNNNTNFLRILNLLLDITDCNKFKFTSWGELPRALWRGNVWSHMSSIVKMRCRETSSISPRQRRARFGLAIVVVRLTSLAEHAADASKLEDLHANPRVNSANKSRVEVYSLHSKITSPTQLFLVAGCDVVQSKGTKRSSTSPAP